MEMYYGFSPLATAQAGPGWDLTGLPGARLFHQAEQCGDVPLHGALRGFQLGRERVHLFGLYGVAARACSGPAASHAWPVANGQLPRTTHATCDPAGRASTPYVSAVRPPSRPGAAGRLRTGGGVRRWECPRRRRCRGRTARPPRLRLGRPIGYWVVGTTPAGRMVDPVREVVGERRPVEGASAIHSPTADSEVAPAGTSASRSSRPGTSLVPGLRNLAQSVKSRRNRR